MRPMYGKPDAMVYAATDGKPWHQSGEAIPAGTSAQDARLLAGMGFDVGLFDVAAAQSVVKEGQDPETLYHDCPGYRAVARLTPEGGPDGAPWAIVSDKYRPIQNHEVARFMDDLVGEGGVDIHTAGTFGGGRVIWYMGRLDSPVEVVPNDWLDFNFMITNAHDGTMALNMGLTSVRIVCWNTFQHALADAKNRGKRMGIRHVGNYEQRMVEALRTLGLMRKSAEVAAEECQALAGLAVTDAQMDDILMNVIEGESTRSANVRDVVRDLYQTSDTIRMPGVQGTGWGVLNAFTQYADHVMGQSRSQDQRMFSGWFGGGAELKDAAVQAIHLVTSGRSKPPAGPVTISI